eukprot:2261646-Alexandrium_andersonii.AAC.1
MQRHALLAPRSLVFRPCATRGGGTWVRQSASEVFRNPRSPLLLVREKPQHANSHQAFEI